MDDRAAASHRVVDGPAEPLDPRARLGRLTDLGPPFAVRVAATLRLPDLIASGVCVLGALAAGCGADPDALGRLLRYLVHHGVFTETEPDVFGLTEVGRLLCDHGPAGERDRLDLDGPGARMDLAYTGLLAAVRTGEAGYPLVHGRGLEQDLDAHPGYRGYADRLLAREQEVAAAWIAANYDWRPVTDVTEVGGGTGVPLGHLLGCHPHLRGTLVARPGAVELGYRRLAARGLGDRVRPVPGDPLRAVPAGAEVYLLCRALAGSDDRDAAAVLRRCRAAAAPAGRVLVVEVLADRAPAPEQARCDLRLLVLVGGRVRTLTDLHALAAVAGLAARQIREGPHGLALIEYAPTPGSRPG